MNENIVQTIRLAAQGMTIKEISVNLAISESTTKIRLLIARESLGAKNRAEMIYYAMKEGIIS